MAKPEQRLNIHLVDPNATNAVLSLEKYLEESGLDRKLYELIKIRASQVNGCAYCLDMHLHDARELGEDQRRLDILAAWHEAQSFFTEPERAVLALTEEVTLVAEGGVSDEVWNEVKKHFSSETIVQILMAISAINVWNRMAIATHQKLPHRPVR